MSLARRRRARLVAIARTLVALACAASIGACGALAVDARSLERAPTRLPGDEGSWLDAPEGVADPIAAASGTAAPGAAPAREASGRYAVRPGDSLVSIARRLGGNGDDWRELARANGIADPASIEPGTVLVVPSGFGGVRAAGGPAAPPPAIDLLGALTRAQRFDATFLLERERFAAARAGVTVARAGLLPQASVAAEIARNTDFESADDASGDGASGGGAPIGSATGGVGAPGALIGGDYTQTTLNATLEQALFDRPTALALARARTDADVAGSRLVAAHEALVLRVARAYFGVLRAGAELEFRSSDLDAIRRQLRRAEREYAVGTISITDVLEARARRDLADAQLIDARDALADARGALVEITGLEGADEPGRGALAAGDPSDPGDAGDAGDADNAGGAGGDVRLASLGDDFAPLPPAPADAEAWVDLALDGNATLIAARGSASAAGTLVDEQRARRLPRLAVSASAVAIDSDGPVPDTETGTLALTGTLPILSGGLVSGRIDQAGAEARAADLRLADERRRTVRGAREAYREVLSSIARVRAFEQALTSTRRAAEATEAGFRAGIRTSVEVLQSLRDRFRAEADLAAARYDYLVGSLELQRIAGTLEAGDVRAVNRWLDGAEGGASDGLAD